MLLFVVKEVPIYDLPYTFVSSSLTKPIRQDYPKSLKKRVTTWKYWTVSRLLCKELKIETMEVLSILQVLTRPEFSDIKWWTIRSSRTSGVVEEERVERSQRLSVCQLSN